MMALDQSSMRSVQKVANVCHKTNTSTFIAISAEILLACQILLFHLQEYPMDIW